MSDETQAEKLTARMERMKPSEAPKRRRGINPYALSAVTAVAGVGVGAWLVLAAPDAPAPAPAIETASVSDFQGDGTGTDGFSAHSTEDGHRFHGIAGTHSTASRAADLTDGFMESGLC